MSLFFTLDAYMSLLLLFSLFLMAPSPRPHLVLALALQFPEEELLGEALKAQGQWNPKVLAALAVPLVR